MDQRRIRIGIDPADGPVVAFESTIFSELGIPAPHNRDALDRCRRAVERSGARSALTAVLRGTATVGVDEADFDQICGPATKVAARDLAVAVNQGWEYGATTVSASLVLAAAAGVEVFATGGIGGVHRGVERTGDISADLDALARHRVVTVSAGAKVFLDLPRTVEHLESVSVPVLGWRCDQFPAFHAPTSGLPVAHRVESAAEVAAIARDHWRLGGGGLLVVAPVPAADGIAFDELSALADRATTDVEAAGVSGNAVTPAVLARMSMLSDGRTIAANLSLAEHNAEVAGRIAVALAGVDATPDGADRPGSGTDTDNTDGATIGTLSKSGDENRDA